MRDRALFRSVRLGVEAPDRLREFYLDKLGLLEIESERAGFALSAGATRLEFSPASRSGPHHFAFNIPRNSLDAAVEWLSARIDLFRNPEGGHVFPFPDWDAQAIYAIDPAGNIVEWIARHTVANDSGSAFDVTHMLEVSEVGVVTGNVPILAATLRAGLILPGYRPGTEEFAALGCERGLFILAKEGRSWFPTDVAAVPAPVSIEIDGGGREARRFTPAGALLRVSIV